MSYNFSTSATITRKCGVLANSTITSDNTVVAEACDEAEAQVLAYLNDQDYDWIANYSSLDANDKLLLQAATSKLAARELISRMIESYGSVAQAQTLMDHLRDSADGDIKLLQNKDVQEIMK